MILRLKTSDLDSAEKACALNDEHFVRIDSGTVEKEGHLALLRSGARIPVSKSGYARLKTVFGL